MQLIKQTNTFGRVIYISILKLFRLLVLCRKNALSVEQEQELLLEKLQFMPNTPSTRVKEMMGNTYYWTQVEGRNTPNPNDDWYERKPVKHFSMM